MTDEKGSSDSLPKIRTFAVDLERNRNKKTAENKADDKTPADKDVETEKKGEDRQPEEKKEHLKKALVSKNTDTKKPEDESKKVVSTNPPFHTIDKSKIKNDPHLDIEVAEFEKNKKPEKTSLLESVSDEIEIKEESEEGTIISDTKHKRFNLFSEISKSLSQFLNDLGSIFSGSQNNKLAVPKSKHRKGLIQEATSSTGRFATSDHKQVISRLKESHKNREAQGERKNKELVKKKPEEKKPAVSETKTVERIVGYNINDKKLDEKKPVTEIPTPVLLLEEPDDHEEPEPKIFKEIQATKNDTARKIEKVIAIPRKSVRAVVPEVEPVIPEEPKKITVPEVSEVFESDETEITEELTKSIQPTSGELNSATAVLADKNGEDIILAPSEDEGEAQPNKHSRLSTNAVAVGTVALIAIVTGITFIAYASYQYLDNKLQEIEAENTSEFSNFNRENVPMSVAEPARLLETANQVLANEPELTIITPIVRTDGRYYDLLPSQILSALQINLNSNLNSTIEEFIYGGNSDGEKFIIIVVNNTTNALGGMLNWEKTMSDDLDHIFGSLEISTSTNSLPPSFADFSVEPYDLRILKHYNGNENLVYGFATANKIVITNNSNTFKKVSAYLK